MRNALAGHPLLPPGACSWVFWSVYRSWGSLSGRSQGGAELHSSQPLALASDLGKLLHV